MESLIKAKFNWSNFIIFAVVFRILFIGSMTWPTYLAILIFLQQFVMVFNAMGSVIPMRYLAGAFMCLQMLLGPSFAYMGLDEYQFGHFKMQIPEEQYFGYVIPAVLFFILGLHIQAGKLEGEIPDRAAILQFVSDRPQIAYLFIVVGFVASVISGFFGSEFAFIFVLLGNFKFIGVFLIILGNKKLRPGALFLVFGSIIGSSLANAMFHDLFTWVIFTGAVLAIKYKPSVKTKFIITSLFVLMALVIQQIKGGYREATWNQGQEGSVETFAQTFESVNESGGFFNMEKLGASNVRINQGAIITNVMRNIPEYMPHAEGDELLKILEAAILPRILAPDKLNAGDREFFMKYSGMRIAKGTSMGLSSVGDAYINFGVMGGWVFMFLFGYLFSKILSALFKHSKKYPILILFASMVFYYPIRPDCELQTILGHLVKSCFLLFVIIQIWESDFKLRLLPRNKMTTN